VSDTGAPMKDVAEFGSFIVAFFALLVSIAAFAASRRAEQRTAALEHERRRRFSVQRATTGAQESLAFDVSVAPDFRGRHNVARSTLLIEVTNLGDTAIPKLDVDLVVSGEPHLLKPAEGEPSEQRSYISIGTMLPHKPTVVLLRNVTTSPLTVFFDNYGTYYDTPRDYHPIEGVARPVFDLG